MPTSSRLAPQRHSQPHRIADRQRSARWWSLGVAALGALLAGLAIAAVASLLA